MLSPGQVKLLAHLSQNFQEELAHELISPFLTEHPFFDHLGNDNITLHALYRICKEALKPVACAHAEVLFSPGDEGRQMFFVKSGLFEYALSDGNVLDVHLGPKLWASEACLWVEWRHRGWMRARQPSDTLALSPAKFSEICYLHPKPWYFAKHYGEAFVRHMNEVDVQSLTDVMFDSDMWKEAIETSDSYVSAKKTMLFVPVGGLPEVDGRDSTTTQIVE